MMDKRVTNLEFILKEIRDSEAASGYKKQLMPIIAMYNEIKPKETAISYVQDYLWFDELPDKYKEMDYSKYRC